MTEKKYDYHIQKKAPWYVTIEGVRYNVPSHVCRLLLQLEALADPKKISKKAAKK